VYDRLLGRSVKLLIHFLYNYFSKQNEFNFNGLFILLPDMYLKQKRLHLHVQLTESPEIY
jgi:hypothetical protein